MTAVMVVPFGRLNSASTAAIRRGIDAADDYCPLAGFFLGLDRFNEAAASMPRFQCS